MYIYIISLISRIIQASWTTTSALLESLLQRIYFAATSQKQMEGIIWTVRRRHAGRYQRRRPPSRVHLARHHRQTASWSRWSLRTCGCQNKSKDNQEGLNRTCQLSIEDLWPPAAYLWQDRATLPRAPRSTWTDWRAKWRSQAATHVANHLFCNFCVRNCKTSNTIKYISIFYLSLSMSINVNLKWVPTSKVRHQPIAHETGMYRNNIIFVCSKKNENKYYLLHSPNGALSPTCPAVGRCNE